MTVELREYNMETGEIGSVIKTVGNGEKIDLKTILSLPNYGWFNIEGQPGGANLSRYVDQMGYDTLVATANSARNTPPERRRTLITHEATVSDKNNKAIRIIPIDDP